MESKPQALNLAGDEDDVFRGAIYKEFKRLMAKRIPNALVHVIPKNNEVYDLEVECEVGKGIADIMRKLNEEGMGNHLVGNPEGVKEGSFKSALHNVIAKFIAKLKEENHLEIYYVELGGEPVKTRYILQELLEGGIRVVKYVCVDINKAVASQMKNFMSLQFPEMNTEFVTGKWEDFNVKKVCPFGDIPALFTNLGWQETMFEAQFILSTLKDIMRAEDYLLSELQVIPEEQSLEDNFNSILKFYRHPEFRRFSSLTHKSMFQGVIESLRNLQYECFVFPVAYRGDFVWIAMTTEIGVSSSDNRSHVYVTWYNIKYGMEQWTRIKREYFDVVLRTCTADASILFEIAHPVKE